MGRATKNQLQPIEFTKNCTVFDNNPKKVSFCNIDFFSKIHIFPKFTFFQNSHFSKIHIFQNSHLSKIHIFFLNSHFYPNSHVPKIHIFTTIHNFPSFAHNVAIWDILTDFQTLWFLPEKTRTFSGLLGLTVV